MQTESAAQAALSLYHGKLRKASYSGRDPLFVCFRNMAVQQGLQQGHRQGPLRSLTAFFRFALMARCFLGQGSPCIHPRCCASQRLGDTPNLRVNARVRFAAF